MSKIFGVGLSRTGTFALNTALHMVGIRSVHMPKTIQEIESHAAATDTTVSSGYAFLDIMYPGSKFILTVREPEEWYNSMARTFGDVSFPSDSPEGKVGHWLFHGVPARPEFKEKIIQLFNDHNNRVRDYFGGSDRFLVMNICGGDGFEKLCPFLGKPTKDLPFPKIKCF